MRGFIFFSLLISVTYQHDNTNYGGDLDAIMKQFPVSDSTANSASDALNRPECLTEDGAPGVCLPYYLCNGGVANTDGSGVIDIRMAGNEMSCSYLNVCCLPPNVRDVDNPIRPVLKKRTGCGWRNPNGLGFRITGNNGNEAEFGEFPWMVAVLKEEPINAHQSMAVYVGGGALIHPRAALTGAHVASAARRVRAGEWDTRARDELYAHQHRTVREVVIHPEYNKANLYYDAALLFLDRPFELAPNVGLACIPAPEEYFNTEAECFATGWGKDKFGKEGQYQNILKKVDLHLVEHDKCEAMLRRTRLNKYFNLHPSFICAGGEAGKDTCTGDGGSPLVCPIQFEPDRYKLVGLVAWGIDCGTGVPAAYTHVAALRDWVDRSLEQKGYDTSVYRY